MSAVLAFLLNLLIPDFQHEPFTVFGTTSLFWDSFARHDSGWYYQIARNGYVYTPGGRSTIAFFPVYPMLMRHVGRLFGRRMADVYIGGLTVSWLAFVLAMIGIYWLARLDLPATRARRAALLTAIFPFGFFFGVVYSEALFLACVVWAFYAFRTRRWLLGGLVGAVATATRVNGILMWPALAWIAWRTVSAAEVSRAERVRVAAGLVLVPVGIGAYSLFVYQMSGSPLEWVATIQRWGYYPGGAPWLALVRLAGQLITHPLAFLSSGGAAPYDALNGVTAILVVVAIPFVWRDLGAAYGLFMVVNLWLPLSSGQYEGLGRYCAVMFPVFVWAAGRFSGSVATAMIVTSALFYTLCLALFTNMYPLF